MSSIHYFTGFHILTKDEFEDGSYYKDPQGLYCIIDAPIPKHAPSHHYNGVDPLIAANVQAISNVSPSKVSSGSSSSPFTFTLDITGSPLGLAEVNTIRFYNGVKAKWNNSSSPAVVVGDSNTVPVSVSPTLLNSNGIRNIKISDVPPTSADGVNGEVWIVKGSGSIGGVFFKASGIWSQASIFGSFVPSTGGTFTGPVAFSNNLSVTGAGKAAGAFYAGNVNPTNNTRLNYDGYFYATRVLNAYMADYAEAYTITDEYVPGMVVVLNSDTSSEVSLSTFEYDTDVFGVVSDSYAFCIGGEVDETHAPIALAGKVPVFLDGECKKGWYIVTSNKRGCAKAIKNIECVPRGSIIGRALEDKGSDPRSGSTSQTVMCLECASVLLVALTTRR